MIGKLSRGKMVDAIRVERICLPSGADFTDQCNTAIVAARPLVVHSAGYEPALYAVSGRSLYLGVRGGIWCPVRCSKPQPFPSEGNVSTILD